MPEQARLPEVIPPLQPNNRPAAPYYAPLAPPQDFETETPPVPLSHYLWIVRRHRWRILAFVATCVLATAIVSARMQRIYESTATIDVDFQAPTQIVGQNSSSSGDVDPEAFFATQIKLIQSDSVLRPVAEQFHLQSFAAQPNHQDALKAQEMAAAPVSLKHLKVTRPAGTNLLLINYRSTDPHQAADVANAIANSYLAHTYNIRIRSSASLSLFMEKQLDELKAKMEKSNLALAQFEKDLNVINPEQKTDILSARLLQLNSGLCFRAGGKSEQGSSLGRHQIRFAGSGAGLLPGAGPGKTER